MLVVPKFGFEFTTRDKSKARAYRTVILRLNLHVNEHNTPEFFKCINEDGIQVAILCNE